MLESLRNNIISNQLIELLKVAVLPEGSFSTTFTPDVGSQRDRDETVRRDEFRRLKKVTGHLRRSNDVPQAMEMETIEHFRRRCVADIAREEDHIKHLQAKINSLLLELQAMRSRQVYTQSLSDYFKPICSPVRHLSPEILTTIFRFCLAEDAGLLHTGAPLVLCHVSSWWRSIALGSQRLWSRFSLNFGRTSASKYDEISKFWFRNSGNQSRSLRYDHKHDGRTLLGPQQAFDDLRLSSRLLRTLTCVDFRPQLLLPFLLLPSSDVPLLEAVHLIGAERRDVVITVLAAAPRLHTVHLEMSYLFQGTLPWSQLTSLKIADPMDASHWASAFQQCVQLQYGFFDVVEFVSPGGFDLDSFSATLPHLETLRLTIVDDRNLFRNLFQNFRFPRLGHLSFTNLPFESYLDTSFCEVVQCQKLRTLCFQRINIDQVSVVAFLSEVSALKRLALDVSSLNYLSFSTILHRRDAMLPVLSYLCLVMMYDDVISNPKPICDAIASRFRDGPLKHASLFLWRNEEDGYWEDGYWEDDDDDDDEADGCERTTDDRVQMITAMIMRYPQSDGFDLRISVFRDCPILDEIVEKIW